MGNSHPNQPQTGGQTKTNQGGSNLVHSRSSSRKVAPESVGRAKNISPLGGGGGSKPTTQRRPSPGSALDKSSKELPSRPPKELHPRGEQTSAAAAASNQTRPNKRCRQQAASESVQAAVESRHKQVRSGASADCQRLPPLLSSAEVCGPDRLKETTRPVAESRPKESRFLPPVQESEQEAEPKATNSNDELPGGKQQQQQSSIDGRQPTEPAPKTRAHLNRSSSLYVTRKNMISQPESGSQLIAGRSTTPTTKELATTKFTPAAKSGALIKSSALYSAEPSSGGFYSAPNGGGGGAMSAALPLQRFALFEEDHRLRVRRWLDTQPFDQVTVSSPLLLLLLLLVRSPRQWSAADRRAKLAAPAATASELATRFY